MEQILLKTMFDLPSDDNVVEVIVNKDVVDLRKDPLFVYKEGADLKPQTMAE
jgi:ATP-dependent Clp protease ATP-binding subunit ClpX